MHPTRDETDFLRQLNIASREKNARTGAGLEAFTVKMEAGSGSTRVAADVPEQN